jgi:nucleoside-diphosphate-sugar epimerase
MPLIVENEGLATRDFIYERDIVNGLMLCALKGVSGEVYNLASGTESSILELAKMINQLTHNPTPIEIGPRREWDHSGKRYGYTEKAETSLGFKAMTSLQNGLQFTLTWTLENLHTIEATIQKHVNAHPEILLAINP